MNMQQTLQAAEHLEAAASAFDAGKLDKAADQVHASLRIDPQNTEARILAARIELAANRPKGALASLDCYDLYASPQQERVDINLLRAEALLRADKPDMALPLLRNLVKQFPDDIRVRRMIAGICVSQDETEEAIAHLQHVLTLAPSDASSRSLLAQLLEETDPQSASALLSQSKDPAALLRAARQYHNLDRLRDSEEIYRHLLAVQPDDGNLWLEAALVAVDSGENAIALDRLTQAEANQCDDVRQIRRTRALLNMRAGRFATAGRCWMQLTQTDRNDAEAWAGLMVCAVIEDRAKLVRRASGHLNKYLSGNERRNLLAYVWHFASMGQVVRESRKPAPAQQPTKPSNSPLANMLSRAANTLAQHAETIPNRADTHYHLSVCQNALGDSESARENVAIALGINPRYTTAQNFADALEAAVDREFEESGRKSA